METINNKLRTIHANIEIKDEDDVRYINEYFYCIHKKLKEVFGEETSEKVQSKSKAPCFQKIYTNHRAIINMDDEHNTNIDIKIYNKDTNKDIVKILEFYDFLTEFVKNLTCTGLEIDMYWKMEI